MALLVFLASVVKLTKVLLAWRLVRPLAVDKDADAPPDLTMLSVVIPARNEEQRLEEFETVDLRQQGEKQP